MISSAEHVLTCSHVGGSRGIPPQEIFLKLTYLSLILEEFLTINLYVKLVNVGQQKSTQSKNPIHIVIIQLKSTTITGKANKRTKNP